MKYTGDKNDFDALLKFALERKGSYAEHTFSKELHGYLLTKTKTWNLDKKLNKREYWLDKDDEWVYWRIILK